MNVERIMAGREVRCFMFYGWCGSGSKAMSRARLNMFTQPDTHHVNCWFRSLHKWNEINPVLLYFSLFSNSCQHDCINTEGSFHCSCHDGYESSNNGFSCVDVDECVENNGDCSNICNNLIGSHSCSCERGFELGSDNRTCFDVDECQDDLHDCSHICINTEGTYECACPNGFMFGLDKFNCYDIDECLDSPCIDGSCNNTIGSFHCQCGAGYELTHDGISCADVDECAHLSHSCSHHCLNTVGGWDSKLPKLTDKILIFCAIPSWFSFNCSCPQGMQLNEDSLTCEDIDECEVDSPCSHSCENIEMRLDWAFFFAISLNSKSFYSKLFFLPSSLCRSISFICKCPPGFVLDNDDRTCIDVDECATGHHECSDVCTNTDGSYQCSCSSGKLLSSNGRSCEHLDPCANDNGGCSQICQPRHNHTVCTCRNGFEIDVSNRSECVDINECSQEGK